VSHRLVDMLVQSSGQAGGAAVHLLSGPFVTRGDDRVQVPEGSKRLLARGSQLGTAGGPALGSRDVVAHGG